MKYYAYLIQEGEGCDYTIGCARTLINFEANDDNHAKQVLSEIIKEEYTDDSQLKKAMIFKEPIAFNVSETYAQLKGERETEKGRLQHINDMEEFERLRKKLGK